jgi:hypothetical protein
MAENLQKSLQHSQLFQDPELSQLEQSYSKLLASLNLDIKRSRFRKAFNDYRKITDSINTIREVPENLLNEYRCAVYDLSQLKDIYIEINDYHDRALLKDKLKKLNEGSSDPAEENPLNTIARNTQFELKLFSDLKESGVPCNLGEPRPDILVNNSRGNYAIECKRIFSDDDSKIRGNISDACKQLDLYLNENTDATGIIAVDVTRRLTGGTKYLYAESTKGAKAQLEHDLRVLHRQYAKFWQSNRIKNKRIASIMLYASMYKEDQESDSQITQLVGENLHHTPYGDFLYGRILEDVVGPLCMHKVGEFIIHDS